MDKKYPVPERKETVEEIISDYEKKEIEAEKAKERLRLQNKIKTGFKKMLLIMEICVLAVLSVRFAVILTAQMDIYKTPTYWAVGKKRITNDETEKCLGRIWKIRKAVDSYMYRNKKIPAGMNALYETGMLKTKMICPVTGNEYVFKNKEKGRAFSCPNPEKHGLSGLWSYVKSGPPVVET